METELKDFEEALNKLNKCTERWEAELEYPKNAVRAPSTKYKCILSFFQL